MTDAADAGAATGGYLAPLPKRVLDEDAVGEIEGALDAHARELLERANVLLATLDSDVDSLRQDQQKAMSRVEQDWEQRKAASEAAVELLAALQAQAEELAQRKGRTEVLQQALLMPVDPKSLRRLSEIVEDIEGELKLAQGITGAIRLETIGRLLREASARVQYMQREADAAREALLKETERDLDVEVVEASASFEIGMSILERDLEHLAELLDVSSLAFDDPRWASWEPPAASVPWVRLGVYTHDKLGAASVPCLLPLLTGSGLLIEPGTFRNETIAGVRSLLVRLFASQPPGALNALVVDPVGLGEAIGPLLDLMEHAPDLLGGSVATTEQTIAELLGRAGTDVERVVQRYLRGRYESLVECNQVAGEVLEPYRVLVVLDFPNGFDESSQAVLRKLIEQGPRAGLIPIIVRDPSYRPGFGGPRIEPFPTLEVIKADAQGLWRDEGIAGRWQIRFDTPPPPPGIGAAGAGLAERIVIATGEQARDTSRSALDSATLWRLAGEARALEVRSDLPATAIDVVPDDPTTWWKADPTPGLAVPVGRSGAQDVVTVHLAGGARSGVLVVGQPGSGITTFVHALVSGLALSYPCSGIDLHLVSLGDRSTFATAATAGLPHARLVADAAEPEVALELLERYAARVEAYRADADAPDETDDDDDDDERSAARSVLVLDGIEDLLCAPERISRPAAQLLQQLLHDGGDAGMHVVALLRPRPGATQHALDCLDRLPLDEFSLRILLPSPDEVATRLAGGEAAELIPQRPGDAVWLTGSTADPLARPVRLVLFDSRERYRLFRQLREAATARGITARPQIHDGKASARLELSPLQRLLFDTDQREARTKARLWVGEPVGLGDPVEVVLRRQDGANLLVMSERDELGAGPLLSALTSGVLVHGAALEVEVLDFTPLDGGFTEAARGFEAHWPVRIERRRNITKTFDRVHRVLQDRLASGSYTEAPMLLLLAGIDRARDLSSEGTSTDGIDLTEVLQTILTDGPEVGVHTLAWASSLEGFERRVGAQALREFAVRIVSRVDEATSTSLIDSDAAAQLGDHQAYLYDEDSGRVLRFRPFVTPPATWLAGLAQAAAGVAPDAG